MLSVCWALAPHQAPRSSAYMKRTLTQLCSTPAGSQLPCGSCPRRPPRLLTHSSLVFWDVGHGPRASCMPGEHSPSPFHSNFQLRTNQSKPGVLLSHAQEAPGRVHPGVPLSTSKPLLFSGCPTCRESPGCTASAVSGWPQLPPVGLHTQVGLGQPQGPPAHSWGKVHCACAGRPLPSLWGDVGHPAVLPDSNNCAVTFGHCGVTLKTCAEGGHAGRTGLDLCLAPKQEVSWLWPWGRVTCRWGRNPAGCGPAHFCLPAGPKGWHRPQRLPSDLPRRPPLETLSGASL